ncbi:MAG: RagB/SusD family nutrient uptake outer membrane protein, partial [Bacteroidales bacterium]|nr:RagB/SusD family nutrient uptake outer membrane protein [Bacteroidales bacterium]
YNYSYKMGDKAYLSTYSAAPNNGRMNTAKDTWAKNYEGIERANLCIRGLRAYGAVESDPDMAYLLGEAIVLRAIYYSDLLKAWGDIPMRFDPISPETTYLPKASRDSVYAYLLADLDEAAGLVDWPTQSAHTQTVEKINKAFVKGLRARLALAAGGYQQYPDGIRRSNSPALAYDKMLTIARDECLDIINNNNGTVKLEDEFETVFMKNCQDVVTAGGESLWEIPFAEGRGRMLYTFAVRHISTDQFTGQAKGGQAGPTPIVFYDYDAKDKRRDVTCVPYQWAKAVDNISQQELVDISKWAFGKFRYEWMNRRVTSSNDDGVNKIYMRYAEVILMAAEALNELEGPAAAAPYLKMLRQRAFDQADWSVKVDTYVDALTSREAMFEAIVDEQQYEFCGEMLRKQALIRWNLLGDKIDETKAKMYHLVNQTGEYSDVPSKVYYRMAADGTSLELYGLERGEDEDKSAEYASSTTWVDSTDLTVEKIETIYINDPDTKQFWPIWEIFINSSNNMLFNDYDY